MKSSPFFFQVIFETPQQQRVAILSLNVELQPVSVDQTFRFYNPEQSFFKKALRLPPWHSLTGALRSVYELETIRKVW